MLLSTKAVYICVYVCVCLSTRLIIYTSGAYHWLSKFYSFVWQLIVDVDSQLKHVIETNPIRVRFLAVLIIYTHTHARTHTHTHIHTHTHTSLA